MESYHEIVQPAKELVHSLGERALNWALNWAIPTDVLDLPTQNESARRTAPQLPFEDFEE